MSESFFQTWKNLISMINKDVNDQPMYIIAQVLLKIVMET